MISGFGAREAYRQSSIANFDLNFWYDEVRDVAAQVYGMAGVGPGDVDALMCYDNFSPTVLFSLEGLGFCGQGESGSFVEGGKCGERQVKDADVVQFVAATPCSRSIIYTPG